MKTKHLFSLIILFSILGCQEVLDDCIFWPSKPIIQTKSLPPARVDFGYSAMIKGEVKNEVDDGSYRYFFNISGLPHSLDYSIRGRRIYITGTPEEEGVYRVTVRMTIAPPRNQRNPDEWDDDKICFDKDNTKKTFILRVGRRLD